MNESELKYFYKILKSGIYFDKILNLYCRGIYGLSTFNFDFCDKKYRQYRYSYHKIKGNFVIIVNTDNLEFDNNINKHFMKKSKLFKYDFSRNYNVYFNTLKDAMNFKLKFEKFIPLKDFSQKDMFNNENSLILGTQKMNINKCLKNDNENIICKKNKKLIGFIRDDKFEIYKYINI